MASKGFLIGTVFNAPPLAVVECTTYESSNTDYLQSDVQVLSIADVWTIAFWQKRNVEPQTSSAILWEARGSGGSALGRIQYTQNHTGTDTTNRIIVATDAGATAKQYDIANMENAGPLAPWEHIVIVYNSNGGGADTYRTYWNGEEITNKIASDSLGIGDPFVQASINGNADQTDIARSFTIGAGRNGVVSVEGKIYNLGMWDVELSSAEILSLYNNTAGDEIDLREANGSYNSQANLQHYWRFDNSEARGEDLGVASPLHDLLFADDGAHTFITNDCPQFIPEPVNTNSLLYDVSFGLISKNAFNASGIDASSGSSYTFSFAGWYKFTGSADAGRNALIAVRGSAAASALDWGLDDNSNTDLTCILVNAAQSVRQFQTWSDVITPNAWHHIVLTWDGTTGTGGDAGGPHCYVDGVNVDSGNRAALLNSDGSGFDDAATRFIKVGTQIGGTTDWEGPIFNASIYNSVLSAAEVLELYASGDAQAVNPRVNTGNYVSAGTLLHFYQPGLGVTDVGFGKDYTLTQPPIGLSSGAVADVSDLTADIPS